MPMSTHTDSATETALEAFDEEWQEWHDAHERQFAHPHGFLAVTHLHWLTSEPTGLEGVPGTWSVGADVVRVDLEPGESLQQDLATCPLPPAENRLPVAIEAGEKIPYERQDKK